MIKQPLLTQLVSPGLNLPIPLLPKPLEVPTLEFKPPSAIVPSYKPIVIPPSDLERPEEVEPEEKEERTEQPVPPKLKIPVIDIQLPLPTVEVVAVASYAAVSAVVVTTFAEPVSKKIKQKVQKFLQGKVNKWKENKQKKPVKKNSQS